MKIGDVIFKGNGCSIELLDITYRADVWMGQSYHKAVQVFTFKAVKGEISKLYKTAIPHPMIGKPGYEAIKIHVLAAFKKFI